MVNLMLTQVLTPAELKLAQKLYKTVPRKELNAELIKQIFTPERMLELNKATGQENLDSYWAYLLEYVIAVMYD